MKIRRLAKLTDYRIFRNFRWPNDLPDFAQFNVIYGWNGSGKTSLSNLFRHVQRREQLTEGQIGILIDQTEVAGTEFDTAALPAVRVFNRDAIDRSIFELADQQLPPVFFLGEDSVEKQKKIEFLKKQLDAKLKEVSNWDRKKYDTSIALEAFCAEEAKGIKNLLTVAGGGPFNNYNAANFKADVQRLTKISPAPPILSDVDRRKHLSMKDSKAMAILPEPLLDFPDLAALTSRTQAMLGRSVLSSVITELAENPAIASWVNAGLSFHSGEINSSKCHFCDQALPDHRIRQLEAHFNDEFKRFQLELDTLKQEIVLARNFVQSLQMPPSEALYESLRPEYDKATQTLKGQVGTVQMSFDILLRALDKKRDEPFKTIELRPFITSDGSSENPIGKVESLFQLLLSGMAVLSAAMGKTAFEQLKALIDKHNDYTNKFDAEVKRARAELAQDEVLKALSEWKKKSDLLNSALTNSTNEKEASEFLRKEIEENEIQIRQHLRPAQELNEEVASYLGRNELHFEVEQNGYRITRAGRPALNLSDGERTAIAFLYFLKSLQGTDFDIKTGVVVIDDPVSSLDANSLFSAFSFLKNRTSTAGQLFVMTHNFPFFRQVRNWYYNLPGQKKTNLALQPARFYMLAAESANGQRVARLQLLDPFLHQYESEYHYLFKRVHEEANKHTSQNLENYYAIPNIARRLLESFLAFRVPNKPGELFQKLEAIQYDAAKKTRILRFLHTYSHFDQVGEPDHDPSMLSETPAILKDVLALIQGCDPEHFRCMSEMMRPDEEENLSATV